jgi:hypothetical protein
MRLFWRLGIGSGGGAGRVRRPVAGCVVAGMVSLSVLGLGAQAAFAGTEDFKAVFQDNDNVLAGYSSSGSSFTTTLGMMAGTSPSVAQLTDGTYEAAFEANNDVLALSHLGGGTLGTTLGMDAGTSPAIAALPNGGWIVAFQDNANKLYLYDSKGDKVNTDLGMAPGTNPALAVQPDGTYRIVFQDNDNVLAGYNSTGSNYTTTVGMGAATSPAIAALADGTYEIAVEANTNDFATVHLGTGYSVNTTTLGMDAGTSPAIASQPDKSFKAVFQDNDNVLAGYNSTGSHYTTTVGMKAGTSPAITALTDATYAVAVEANTDDFATVHLSTSYSVNTTTLGMDANTNPALATPAPTAPPTGDCGAANDCTRQTFADALLAYIGAPDTAANEYSVETWESGEGVAAACSDQTTGNSTWPAAWANGENTAAGNPLATTQKETGSYPEPANTSGVQEYVTGSGRTCWQWGVKANGDTLQNGFYPNVVAVLDAPVASSYSQCVDLAEAVGSSPWGTGNFSADC